MLRELMVMVVAVAGAGAVGGQEAFCFSSWFSRQMCARWMSVFGPRFMQHFAEEVEKGHTCKNRGYVRFNPACQAFLFCHKRAC